MKILHIIGSLDQNSGGPLRAVLDLSAKSRFLGVQSEILGLGPVEIKDNPLELPLIHSLPLNWSKTYQYSRQARGWLHNNLKRFDLLILHGMWTHLNWIAARECIKSKVPYVYFPHGMLDLWSIRGQGWLKRIKKTLYWHWRESSILENSASVFFTTTRELTNAKKTFSLPPMHPLVVVPYGIVSKSRGLPLKPSEHVRQDRNIQFALFMSRVHHKKRPDILIKAWAAAGIPESWKLVIAGPCESDYLIHLSELTKRLGISSSVQFTGPVAGEDKAYLLREASWFLLPSEQENFGIAVIEAISYGTAVAVSDQVYLADYFPPNSEVLPVKLEAWTLFMKQRMMNEDWRENLAARLESLFAKTHAVSSIVEGWNESLRMTIESRNRGS